MLRDNNACRYQEDHPAEVADPAMCLVIGEDGEETEAPGNSDYACETHCADPDQASKFIKGLTFALPLSISLWAVMILGLRAIF